MFIKKIILNNFKSYSGCTTIQDIPPCHNVLIGGNGSGKSNILEAIDFVLNFENKPLGRKDIATLLSPRETDGFVEILFSLSDFPFGNEFSLRKKFSLKTNTKFYVNEKLMNLNKTKVFLEIVGINFMKPLTIQNFVKLSREELLDYVIRKMGASIMETYNSIQRLYLTFEGQKEKLDQFSDLLEEARISDDKEYLTRLNKYKDKKNLITAHILKRKIDSCILKKIKLEADLGLHSENDTSSSTISLLHHSYTLIHNALLIKMDTLEDLINEEVRLIGTKEKVNLKQKDLIAVIEMMKKSDVHKNSDKILTIENRILSISNELETTRKELMLKRNIFTQLEANKDLNEAIRLTLLLQIKITQDFSEEEKNIHVQREINSFTEKIHHDEEEINVLSIRKEEILQNKSYLHGKIKELKNKLQQEELLKRETFQEKQQLNSFLNLISDLQRNEMTLENEVSEIFLKIKEKVFKIKKKVGSAIIDGAESILTVTDACRSSESHRWLSDCYFGMVIDNFECSEELNLALETAIGKRLFAHIVTNNKVGTALLKEMNNNKLPGEVLFIPMDNILEFNHDYPVSEDAEPILNKLRFKPNVTRAMKFLFGHIMICRNIDVAIDIIKKNTRLTYVTLEGDKVSKSVLYGGYISKSKCSRTQYLEINHLQDMHSLKTESLEKLKSSINKLESDINKVSSIIQNLKEQITNTDVKENLERVIAEEHSYEKELLNIENQIKKRQNLINKLLATKNILMKEVSEPSEQINVQVNADIMKVNKEIEGFRKLLNDKILELTTLESKQQKLENDLSHQRKLKDLLVTSSADLLPDHEVFMRMHSKMTSFKTKEHNGLFPQSDTSEIEYNMKKLQHYGIKIEIIGNRLNKIRKQIEETEKSIAQATNEKLKIEEEINEHLELTIVFDRNKEKITGKLMLYNQKLHEYETIYNEVKKLFRPSDKYTNFSLPMLQNELKNVNKILDSALLESRIDKSKKVVAHMYKKYEWLQNIFSVRYVIFSDFLEWFHSYIGKSLNDISDTFSESFRCITAGGKANLFVDDDGSTRNWPALENITGLQICVQFPNSVESWNLLELSLSQKLMVNLALTFSLLKVCEVHVCLFDEIERPLHNEHKRLLCHQISAFGESLQVFSASHSKEWIKGGKILYQVTFRNLRSNIKKLTETEANNFLHTTLMSGRESLSLSELDLSSSFSTI